mgnify:CR=1 FL=1
MGLWNLRADENVSVGDFDNVIDAKKFGVMPGQKGDSAYTFVPENKPTLNKTAYNSADYKYSCCKAGYFYGLKNDNTEVIGICTDNIIIPVYAGAGFFLLKTGGGKLLLRKTGVRDFTETEYEGYPAVTVTYDTEGNYDLVYKAETTYVFKDRCISAISKADCIGMAEGLYSAYFEREPLNIAENYKKRVSYDWIYPENNDFAYREVDAYVVSEAFGDMALYAFVRDENSSKKLRLRGDNFKDLPVNIARNTRDIDYTYKVDYTVVKTNETESCEALFKSKNMDFSAGIASVTDGDRTTLYYGRHLLLNLSVKNISESDIDYTVRYSLMDYYNNEVDSHIFYGNKLPSGKQANRNLDLELDNYGMYYLNLYVTTKDFEYRECYPFAMIEEFDFKHRDDNPFGICATHTETEGQGDSTISIVNKMGLSIVRLGESYNQRHFIEHMKKEGIKRYTAGTTWCSKPENKEKFRKLVEETCNMYMGDCTYFLLANEVDTSAKGNYDKSKKFLEELFVPYTYKTAYEYISEKYPDKIKDVIWQSNCHGTTEWLEAFYETGMWDASEVIDIHSYSSPSGPDKIFSNQPVSMYANMYSNEYAMVRWKRLIRRYGKKRMMVGETGYPTPPHTGTSDTCEVDIRTGADFNVRIALMFLEAGAEDIIYYCLYDRTGAFVGTSDWNEMYFGACYNYDYYGVYMPKPWAAAYANLTRRFDGYKSCRFNSKYDEDETGTLRAYDVETEGNGKFTVVWSNVYQLPNTTAEGRVNKVKRIPMPAWESRWTEKETRIFDTELDEVKVVDIMGNIKFYKAENGRVEIEVSGSPIFIYGIC